jgi:hypothetical protein
MLFIPDLHSLLRPPYIFLILGGVSLCVGVVSTFTGVTWAYYGRVIHRAEEPRQFWEDVATCYLIGVYFIGYFLYKVYAVSN